MMKALFFDIDGTLIDIATHRVPESSVRAIEEARRRGNMIFIATGRSNTIVDIPGLPAEVIDGVVALNGAVCLAGDEAVSLTPIPREPVRELSELCIERGYTCLFVTLEGMRVANGNAEFVRGFQEYFNLKPVPETDFGAMMDEDVYQMTVFFTEDDERELKRRFPELEFNRWFPTFADITAAGVNKARGIGAMARYFGIDRADTVAFGDGGNDIPMLRAAGTGVAMGNGSDEVKAAADMVTDRIDRDGIAKAMRALDII